MQIASSTGISKSIARVAVATAMILMVPLVAMQFTQEVAWSPLDFVVAGALLFGAGLAYVLVSRQASHVTYRVAVGIAIAAGLLLIWVNLAVGIIGAEDNPANLMYAGVLLVAAAGALIARFRPLGMAIALLVTGLAQLLVAVIVLVGDVGAPEAQRLPLLMANGFFFTLFAASGLLFWHAARSAME